MPDEKKMRFFGCPEMGDGVSWVYLGSNPETVGKSVVAWVDLMKAEYGQSEPGLSEGQECTIKVRWMTDAEVEALPDI